MNDDRTVYLLPEYEMESEAEPLLEQFYDIIFEEELSDWITDPSTWPENRTYAMFLEWFEVEHNSVVRDLVGGVTLDDDEP